MTNSLPIVLAINGASGVIYGRRLLELIARAGRHVHLVVSPMGRHVIADELGVASPAGLIDPAWARQVSLHAHDDLPAVIASGSYPTAGMAVCPCSSNTLAAIAAGTADNLITRAAHVTLKERRRLVLVTRETPLSPIEVENMARLSRAGAIICPAAPAFYHGPKTIADLVDFVVLRVLDLLGLQSPDEIDTAARYPRARATDDTDD